jgi:hypothetical protein
MVLMTILIISSFMLMPGQSTTLIGIEVAAVGFILFVIGTGMEVYALRRVTLQNRNAFIADLIVLELGVLPYVLGGVLLLLGTASGFYWIAAGVIISFVKAVMDAWVLLVEINR